MRGASVGRSHRLGSVVFTAALALGFARAAIAGTVLYPLGATPLSSDSNGYDLVVSPDGKHVYVADLGASELVSFTRDPVTGALTPLETLDTNDGVSLPLRLSSSPDGRHLYVICNRIGGPVPPIVVLARDTDTGLLTVTASYDTSNDPRSVMVSPDGVHVYVVTGSALYIFARDQDSGALSLLQTDVGFAGKVLALEPSGTRGFMGGMANSGTDTVGQFATLIRNPATGLLSTTGGYNSIYGLIHPVADISFAPDGVTAYAAGDEFVSSFQDQGATLPQPLQYAIEGKGGVAGTTFAHSVAVTETDVYVAGNPHSQDIQPGQIVHFRRDANGQMTYVEQLRLNGTGNAVALSPDGRHLYASTGYPGFVQVMATQTPCTDEPRTDCRPATSALLSINAVSKRRSVRFRWRNDDTSFPLAGDPWGGSTYALCLYEDVGGTSQRTLDLAAPQGRLASGRGWIRSVQVAQASKYVYRDRFTVPDGVRSAKLERQRAKIVASGSDLTVPPLPVSGVVTAQLSANFGECWTATFPAANVLVSDEGRFRASLP